MGVWFAVSVRAMTRTNSFRIILYTKRNLMGFEKVPRHIQQCLNVAGFWLCLYLSTWLLNYIMHTNCL